MCEDAFYVVSIHKVEGLLTGHLVCLEGSILRLLSTFQYTRSYVASTL